MMRRSFLRWCVGIIKVPHLAESVTEGKLSTWSAKVGEPVEEDDPLCEIDTDKTVAVVRAEGYGKLVETLVPEGTVVKVDQEIAKFEKMAKPAGSAAPKAAKAAETTSATPAAPAAASTPAAPAKAAAPAAPAAPAQKVVRGSDPRTRLVEISTMRQRIADRLKASQNTAAMLTTFNEIDMTNVMKLRETHREAFLKKHDVKLGLMSPFVKASAAALMEVPIINASWADTHIQYHDYVDISVAVSSPRGLVVPVLRDVQDMNFADIEKKIAEFGQKAKGNKLSIPEMTGGTFTISNGGTFGSWMGTPIINPPQSAILGMHATKNKAWVDGKGNVVARPIMAVALTYDHRLIDGRDAVTFLVKVKNIIENPELLVLDLA